MTYQIVQTMPSATKENDVAAMTYFMDTFLPARGWTVGPNPTQTNTATKTYWIFQRNYTDLFTNTPAKSYLWCSYNSSTSAQFTQYEDATYDTVPGDKGNDPTNSSFFGWSFNNGRTQFPWKFWVSSENNKSFIVTRNGTIEFWDCGCNFPQYKTWPENEGPSIDRYATCLWLGMKESAPWTNLPTSVGSSSSELILYCNAPGRYENFEGAYLLSPINVKFNTTSLGFPWDQPDVSLYCPASVNYTTTASTSLAVSSLMNSIYLVQFNAEGDYYILTKDSPNVYSFAFNVGPTIPDFVGE